MTVGMGKRHKYVKFECDDNIIIFVIGKHIVKYKQNPKNITYISLYKEYHDTDILYIAIESYGVFRDRKWVDDDGMFGKGPTNFYGHYI